MSEGTVDTRSLVFNVLIKYARELKINLCIFVLTCYFLSSFSGGATAQNRFIDSPELAQYPGGSYSATNGYEYLLDGTNVNKIDDTIYAESGEASLLSVDGLNMQIDVSMDDNGSVVLPRFNYPNYIAYDENDVEHEITIDDNNRIEILFTREYSGIIWVKYVIPWYWRLADIISLLTFATMSAFECSKFIKEQYRT